MSLEAGGHLHCSFQPSPTDGLASSNRGKGSREKFDIRTEGPYPHALKANPVAVAVLRRHLLVSRILHQAIDQIGENPYARYSQFWALCGN